MNLFRWTLIPRKDLDAINADAAQAREHASKMATHAATCEARTAVAEAALALLRGDRYEQAGRGAPVLDSLRVFRSDERWRVEAGRREEVECSVEYFSSSDEMVHIGTAGRCDYAGLEWVVTSMSAEAGAEYFKISLAMVAVAARRTK